MCRASVGLHFCVFGFRSCYKMGMCAEKTSMTHQQLDFWFPFIVFTYGFTMCVVLNLKPLVALAEKHFPPDLHRQMEAHRYLAVVCLVVGALWSLQNFWFQGVTF
jgi:hypothetical protein